MGPSDGGGKHFLAVHNHVNASFKTAGENTRGAGMVRVVASGCIA
jgi:hypothetical protein